LRKIHNVLDPEKDEEKKVKGMGKGQIVAFSSITLLPLPTVNNSVAFLTLLSRYQIFGPYLQIAIAIFSSAVDFFGQNSGKIFKNSWQHRRRFFCPLLTTVYLKQSVTVTSLLLVTASARL
jgi:hypothetical protein